MANFISTDTIFANVKSMLGSYDSAGLLDEISMFGWTRYIVSQFGTIATKERSILIDVECHKAELPEDFHLLQAAYLCSLGCEQQGPSTYRGKHGKVTYTLKDWFSTSCYDKCDVCFDNNEYVLTRTLTSEFQGQAPCKLDNRVPLRVDKSLTKSKCVKDCINLSCQCEYTFNIIGNTIHTNFESGYINLMYYALPIDEEGYPLIIEEPILEKAVEDYLTYMCLYKLYLNGEDTRDKMMFVKQEHILSLREALFFVKLPTFRSLMEYAKKRKNYLSLFNIESNSDYNNGSRVQQYPQRT